MRARYHSNSPARALSPWPTINAEKFNNNTTTVLALKAEGPHDIIDMISLTAEDLLDTIIDSCTTFGSNNVYIPSTLIIVLTPDHAKLLDRDGWDKQRIREHIHARAHNEVTFINNRGIIPVRPESFKNRQLMPVTRSPSDIEIVVAGGRGGHSSVILPWGLYSEAIIEPVLLPNGNVANTIYDFKQA